MKRLVFQSIFFVCLIGYQSLGLTAETVKKALVIGNSDYLSKPLANPVSDAKLMADTLKQIGFEVTLVNNVVDKNAFFALVNGFYDKLPQGSVAFVYYAGHGVQINRLNYLLPTGLVFKSQREVATNAYPLEKLQEHLEQKKGGASVNILVFDACRNNPFQLRGVGNEGFASMISPKQTLIAFSTAPGEPAEDGLGEQNSIYTKALAEELKKPGQAIEVALKNVARIVRTKTHDDQRPWVDSSLMTEIILNPLDGKSVIGQKVGFEPSKRNKQTTLRETGTTPKLEDNQWYMAMSEAEWAQLDLDIQKRVQYLSEEEIPTLKKRASAGNVVAMTTLGLAYRDGISKMTEAGTNRVFRSKANNSLSLKYIRQAANAGFPVAQAELGEMLFAGKGVDKNSREALQWLERAARVNYPRAKIDLMQVKLTLDPSSAQDVGADVTELMKSLMPNHAQTRSADLNDKNQTACTLANIAGNWQGAYTQGTTKTVFTLDLKTQGKAISGHSIEIDTRTGKSGNVEANWAGFLDGDSLKLTKTYMTEGGAFPVSYVGACTDNGNTITGKWVISMNSKGEFNMTKRLMNNSLASPSYLYK